MVRVRVAADDALVALVAGALVFDADELLLVDEAVVEVLLDTEVLVELLLVDDESDELPPDEQAASRTRGAAARAGRRFIG